MAVTVAFIFRDIYVGIYCLKHHDALLVVDTRVSMLFGEAANTHKKIPKEQQCGA